MENKLNSVQENILALLFSNNLEPIKGKTWFQKEMFLISKNFPLLEEELDFEPYLFGPDSEIAEDELNELKKCNLVKNEDKKILLTDKGKRIARKIYSQDKKRAELIDRLKDFANGLEMNELLAFVYFSYPEMTEESTVFEEIKKNRISLALKLLKKEKVSLEKAAQIAGLPLERFYKQLNSD